MTLVEGPSKVKFLWGLAEKFEGEGNISESFKSAQTALLLQHSLGDEYETQFPTPTNQAANDLVLKCNAAAVEHFQENQYDIALFLLDRALFLTNDTPATNCFGKHNHDRLRLRAATYNNLGCLEKRRNNFEESLDLLQKAVEVECLVDPDVGPSASTHLNLCTVLNKLSRHQQAAAAAERAVRSLKFQLLQGHSNLPHYAQMLAMAQYNLGVSLEFAAGPDDLQKAVDSYRAVVEVSQKYLDRGHSNLAEVAAQAVERIQQTATGGPLSLPPVKGQPAQSRVFALTMPKARGAFGSEEGDVPTSASSYTPRPPSSTASAEARGASTSRPRMANRGFGTTTPAGRKTGVRVDTAMSKHADRIMSRQKKQQQMRERDEVALRRAQMAHVKEKQDKIRKEKELEEQRREEMAHALYEKMVAGLRAEEVRKVKTAAKKIQKVWRGYLARDYMQTLVVATVKIQSVFRSFSCRKHIRIQNELAKLKEQDAIRNAQRNSAAIKIQQRVRQFLKRLHIIRSRRVNKIRRHAAARQVQTAYRRYRQRVQQRIIDRLEAERRADQERQLLLHRSAVKIQRMFRAFKSRRFLRVVKQEQQRRGEAATKIQAIMRGALTRTWFTHYRLYRRQQELSTARNLLAIRKIQRMWRIAVAKIVVRRVRLEKHLADHQRKVFKAALCIQCAWRSYKARCRAGVRRDAQRRRVAAAKKIQSRWRVYVTRKAYLFRRDEARLLRKLEQIQRWGRAMVIRKRHLETARYHAEVRKREQIALLRTAAALEIQSAMRAKQSEYLGEELRVNFLHRSKFAAIIQAVGRHYAANKELALLQRITYLVRKQAEHEDLCRTSSITVQKNTRGYLGRLRAHRLKKQRIVVTVIQCAWRQYRARKELRGRQMEKRRIVQEAAARRIQRSVRLFLKRQELKRLDAYYTERCRQRLLQQRREEAAICVQSQWRGYATRKAVGAARSRLLQNTIDAIRIQRAYRTHRFRRDINAEIARRRAQKQKRHQAAIQVQALWRGVLAREYTAMLRERLFNNTVAVIVIQCAWRCARARQERKVRRAQRLLAQQLTAQQHDSAVHTADLVNAFGRAHLDQLRARRKLELTLAQQLADKKRQRALFIYRISTRIQAWYRGCYERVYVRGLLKEKRERDAIAAAKAKKENHAALHIQCAWRCHWARKTAALRRYEKIAGAQAEQLERERTADPSSIIKSLFWAHEASIHRDLTKERVEREERMTFAVIKLQKTVRMFLCTRRVARMKKELQAKRAAERIQTVWRKHDTHTQAIKEERRLKCTLTIQAIARMFFVRLHWERTKAHLLTRRAQKVDEEERRDRAAAKIQAMWRRVSAQRYTAAIREEKLIQKEVQRNNEAAKMIQKQYRRHLAKKKVQRMKIDRAREKAREKQRQQQQERRTSERSAGTPAGPLVPAPPATGRNETGPPPPPRRRSSAAGSPPATTAGTGTAESQGTTEQ